MRGAKRARAIVTVLVVFQVGNVILQAVAPHGHMVLGVLFLVVTAGSWLVTNQLVTDARRRSQR